LEMGDLNNDQDITSIDAAIVRQIANATLMPTAEQQSAADVNQDGVVTDVDAQIILIWASMGYGTTVPESFSEPLTLPVIASMEGTVGSDGGSISLNSGVALSISPGQLDGMQAYQLDKTDPAMHDAIGNKTCFQVYPDPSYYPETTVTIPYDAVTGLENGPEDIEGVVFGFYDPLFRGYRMAAAEYVPGETGLTVRLDQIRQDSLFLTQSNALLMAAKTTLSSRGISDSIKNTFFSIWIVVTEPFYIDSQSKKEILPVPYYEQGETPHCWAVATCMAMRYVLDDDFVKPWEIVSTLNIPDGLGGSVAYGGSAYADYIKQKTGSEIDKSFWTKPSNQALRLYIKKQILDEHRPVILLVNEGTISDSHSHAILVVGYEIRGGNAYLYIHDPKKNSLMYSVRSWEDMVSRWVNTAVYYSFVITGHAASSLKPVTVYTLSKGDAGNSPAFVSPMQEDPTKINSNYRCVFDWYDNTTTTPVFVSHNGDGLTVPHIPNYYTMDLRLSVANASENPVNVKVVWNLSKIGGGGKTYTGEMEVDLAPKSVKDGTVVKFIHDNLNEAVGDYTLDVEVYELTSFKTCDEFFITIPFDKGIELKCDKKTQQTGTTEIELTWNTPGNFDGYYQTFKQTTSNPSWKTFARIDPPSPNEAKDTNYAEQDNPVYAVLARKDKKFFISSDKITIKKLQGSLAYNYYYFDTQQNIHTGIGFNYLVTGDRWEWTLSGDQTLLLLGVTPPGGVMAFVSDDTESKDYILIRDDWGRGVSINVEAPCRLAEGYDVNRDEIGMTDAGNVYFIGTREVEETDHFGNPRKAYYDYVFSSDGNDCFQALIDMNNDGDINEKDHLTGINVQDFDVSSRGNTLLLWDYSNWALGAVDLHAGGVPVWLTSNCGGVVKVSGDGAQCLFEWYDEQTGDTDTATMPSAGGSIVKLSAATGLEWTPEYTNISSDGKMVCGFVVEMTGPNPEDFIRAGLAIANADGTGFRWIDTGQVFLQGPPKFSPDNQQIIFAGSDKPLINGDEIPNADIYMIRVDGTQLPDNLTNTPDVTEVNPYIR